MLSKVVEEIVEDIDQPELGNVSLHDPAAADATLVAAAKRGDGRAFEILVGRHEQKIFFVARRITRRHEDAEDVVQQSFQKAFTHLRKFEGRSAFSTWLTRIAITEALMFLRRSRGLREVLIDDVNASEGTNPPWRSTIQPRIPKLSALSVSGRKYCPWLSTSCRLGYGRQSGYMTSTSDHRRRLPELWEFPFQR